MKVLISFNKIKKTYRPQTFTVPYIALCHWKTLNSLSWYFEWDKQQLLLLCYDTCVKVFLFKFFSILLYNIVSFWQVYIEATVHECALKKKSVQENELYVFKLSLMKHRKSMQCVKVMLNTPSTQWARAWDERNGVGRRPGLCWRVSDRSCSVLSAPSWVKLHSLLDE